MADKPVTISDAEVKQFGHDERRGGTRFALSAFLLARLPEPKDKNEEMFGGIERAVGFNACREQVLQGRGDKT